MTPIWLDDIVNGFIKTALHGVQIYEIVGFAATYLIICHVVPPCNGVL